MKKFFAAMLVLVTLVFATGAFAARQLVPCPTCGGAGYITHQEVEYFYDADGNSYPQYHEVQEPCPGCGGFGAYEIDDGR